MKKPQVITIAFFLSAVVGGGGYFYYTTTPNYALDQAKKACAANDIRLMARNSVARLNNETRELTSSEVEQMATTFSKGGSCPYSDTFSKKATLTKLDSEALQKYGVKDGLLVSFAGEDKNKSLKLLKFNGRWRFLLVEATYQSQEPSVQPGPQSMPQYQVEINSPPATIPPATNPSVPRP